MGKPMKVNLIKVARGIKQPWRPVLLGCVEKYDVKVAIFDGEFFWHKHERHDECMLIYSGTIVIDFDDGPVELKEGDTIFIPKGTPHRSRSKERSIVLLFEGDGILSDFVNVKPVSQSRG